MTPEVSILKALLSRDVYNKYYPYIYEYFKGNRELSIIINSITNIYNIYNVETISLEELSLDVKTKHNDSSVLNILSRLESISVSVEHIEDLLKQIKNKALAHELAVICMDITDGKKEVEDIYKQIEKFEQGSVIDQLEDKFVSTDLEELYEHTVKQQGLRWRLSTLNRMLGSLRKGDFGFLFARPETGKTTFLASEITFFASQTEGNILWFNNEEQGSKVALRCYQAALNLSLPELFSNVEANKQKYRELTGDRIRIFDSASIHKRAVEQLCEELKPSLIVFDQIDKIKGFTDDREDLRLGSIYIWARELAKEYCPVIGVCQANGEAEGKAWLTMDQVANAKTAKQAEADWILGIGKKNDDGMELVRHLHLSKNKLAGDEDTDPELRHGKQDVIIDPLRARYKDVI